MDSKYIEQVALLMRIAPEVSRIQDFALHGGTAINLFHHNMPRLSVDIDLTYIPYRERQKDLSAISGLLLKLSERLKKIIPGIQTHTQNQEGEEIKLFCTVGNSTVKIEVNTINRGIISNKEPLLLCNAAQQKFDCFFEMNLVPEEQLFGGKIVAALDRQHPRDLFDTMKLLDRDGLNDKIMEGFLFCLLSSNRPLHEILNPFFANYEQTLNIQFKGMTSENFTYQMYENERERLMEAIKTKLTAQHKNLLLSFIEGHPDWIYDDWSKFPGIAWKIKNLDILRKGNPYKYKIQIEQVVKFFC
jgi:predicted nucleotidyltransferase component of viral defense system